MIASISSSRKDGQTSFHRLTKYLTMEREPGTSEYVQRGAVVLSDNIYDPERVAEEMRSVVRENKLVTDPIMHFQIAWRPTERPSESEWQDAAKRAIAELGFSEHQYMVVAHDDKEHFHVHVMLNRVHPETLLVHNPRMTKLTLEKTMRVLENEYGREETPGLYRWDKETMKPVRNSREELARIREESQHERSNRPGREKQDYYADTESVKAFASKEPAKALRQLLTKDPSWQQVHLMLAKHGLELHKADKGGYSVSVEGSTIRVKASDVFRFAFSGKENRDNTEHLLGEFEPRQLGAAFDDVTIDYSQQISDEVRRTHAKHLSQSNPSEDRRISTAKTIDDMRSVSRLDVVRWTEADKMLLQTDAQSDIRQSGAKASISVRRGSSRQHQEDRGGRGSRSGVIPLPNINGRTSTASVGRSAATSQPEDRAQRAEKWKASKREEATTRRAQRVAERQKERDELKKDYAAVRRGERGALHDHTEGAKKARAKLNSDLKRDKTAIRALAAPWKTKQVMLSQRVMEHVIAKQHLNHSIAVSRTQVPKSTFEQWVEAQAEKGDKRAVAQMRGWRYQDQRNVRKTEREVEQGKTKNAGQLSGNDDADGSHSRKQSDWQEIANERIRQLQEQEQQLAGLRNMKWKADARSGDVTYTIAGVAALVDKGKTITVLNHDLDSTKIALQMAVHKYGNVIDAKGSDAWERQLIRAAVQQNLNVVFTDQRLQRALVQARQEQEAQKTAKRTKGRSQQMER